MALTRFVAPVAVGVVVFVAAVQFPASAVPGSPKTGPTGLGRPILDPDGLRPTARWERGGQEIELRLHPRRPCVVEIQEVTSTAPGRIEVATTVSGAHGCTGARTTQTFLVPKPTVVTAQQGVKIQVGPDVVRLHAYVNLQPQQPRHRWHHRVRNPLVVSSLGESSSPPLAASSGSPEARQGTVQ